MSDSAPASVVDERRLAVPAPPSTPAPLPERRSEPEPEPEPDSAPRPIYPTRNRLNLDDD
jgi:hypothetical protein